MFLQRAIAEIEKLGVETKDLYKKEGDVLPVKRLVGYVDTMDKRTVRLSARLVLSGHYGFRGQGRGLDSVALGQCGRLGGSVPSFVSDVLLLLRCRRCTAKTSTSWPVPSRAS